MSPTGLIGAKAFPGPIPGLGPAVVESRWAVVLSRVYPSGNAGTVVP